MIEKLAHAKAVIWDFDGVFYDFDAVPNRGFHDLCDHSNAEAVCKFIPNLSFDDAVSMAHQSYEKYKECITAYIPFAAKINMSELEFKEIIFHEYHKILFKKSMDKYPFVLAAIKERTELLEALNGHVKQYILSHSSYADFLEPSLKNMEVDKYFSKNCIWDYEAFNFENKGKNAKGMEMAIEKIGLPTSQIVFVEDTLKNLQVAKQAFPEIFTVLKTKEDIKPEGVDLIVKSQTEFLEILAKNKGL